MQNLSKYRVFLIVGFPIALILLENAMRNYAPQSMFRPINGLEKLEIWNSEFWKFCGYYFGWIFDIEGWILDIEGWIRLLPIDEAKALFYGFFKVCWAMLNFFVGLKEKLEIWNLKFCGYYFGWIFDIQGLIRSLPIEFE